jgi:hypothetical protein
MGQVVQLVGAVLIVGAYVAAQQKRLRFDSVQFLGLNALGAGILAVVAAVDRQLGFLLLETVWAWVSARGLRRAIKAEQEARRAKRPARAGRSAGWQARRRHRKNPLRRV